MNGRPSTKQIFWIAGIAIAAVALATVFGIQGAITKLAGRVSGSITGAVRGVAGQDRRKAA